MADVQDWLDYAEAQIAPLDGRAPYSPANLRRFDGRIPESLSRLFARIGIGVWGRGRWQTVDPLTYDGLLRLIFAGDPGFDPDDLTLVALGGFGRAWVWHRSLGYLHLSPYPNRVAVAASASGAARPAPEVEVLIPFATVLPSDRVNDEYDAQGKPLFDSLVRAHGPLPPGQIFAPRLHPALGGRLSVDTMRPVPAVEALALMAQGEPFTLVDGRSMTPVPLRPIGPQG